MYANPHYSTERANPNGKAIASRIAEIEDSLIRESWLPISLRGFLATELPQLRRAVCMGGKRLRRKIEKRLLVLSFATWVYGPSPLDSETVFRLQALDLEVNGSTSHESKKEH